MAEFERNASDPKRLFQSSFRLNEEERFRKTCFPTLLRMERKLGELLSDYAKHAGYPFLLSPDSEPYHCILEKEIEQRIVNETVFGFEHPRRRSRRTPSLSAGSHLGEDTTERGSISGRRASIQSSLLLSGKPTRRSRAPSVVGDEGTVSVRSPVPSVVSDVKEGGKFTATSMDGIKGTVHDADEVPDSQGGDRDESVMDDRSVAGSVTSRRTSVLSVTTQGRSTRSSQKPSTGTGGVSRPVSAMSRRGPSKPNSSTSQWAPGPLPSPNAALRRPFPAEKSSPGNCRPPIRRVGSVSSLKSMPSLPSRSSVNKSVTPNHSGPSEAATVPRLKSRKSVVGTLPTTPTPAGGGGLSRGGGPTSPLTGTAETSRTFAPSLTRKHHGQSPQSNSRGPICMTCNQRQGTPLVASGSRTPVQLSPRLPNTSVIGNGGLVKTSTLQSPTFRSRSSLRSRSSMADLRQLSQSQTSQSTSLETSMDAPKCKATEPLSPPVSPSVCNVLKTEAVVPSFSPQANTPASPHHHDRSAHLHTPNTPIKELNNFDSVATETPNTFT
ncbi:hypothetical protein IWQ62_005790 [Dispira parvispora]|uniref:Uncharacterized protein n=1 Tax=Dispira parvispora TaxID=1520584 RepID=A0A9W8AJ18_9FUNG|nr:hypothetical protein IWQ62_005790 [Dispira parvispora]